MRVRKGINGDAKEHQWECERTSMGMREGNSKIIINRELRIR